MDPARILFRRFEDPEASPESRKIQHPCHVNNPAKPGLLDPTLQQYSEKRIGQRVKWFKGPGKCTDG